MAANDEHRAGAVQRSSRASENGQGGQAVQQVLSEERLKKLRGFLRVSNEHA